MAITSLESHRKIIDDFIQARSKHAFGETA